MPLHRRLPKLGSPTSSVPSMPNSMHRFNDLEAQFSPESTVASGVIRTCDGLKILGTGTSPAP